MRFSYRCVLFFCVLILSGCTLPDFVNTGQTIDVPCSTADLISILRKISEIQPAGTSTINLAANCEYVLDDASTGDDGISVLPTIVSSVVFNGDQTTFKIVKLKEDPPLRMIRISASGSLFLNQIIITTESAPPLNPYSLRDETETGGAIINQGELLVTKVSFLDNFASKGGAIYSTGTLSVDNSAFEGNAADYLGGAIYSEGTIHLSNTPFTNNQSGYGHANYGGAIYQYGGDMAVSNCEFVSNEAIGSYSFGGGAIAQLGGVLTISGSRFDSNEHYRIGNYITSQLPINFGGGAILLMGVSFSVTGSDFENNHTTALGGAISFSDEVWIYKQLQYPDYILEQISLPQSGTNPTTATIENCNFTDNQAVMKAGAIHSEMGAMILQNTNLSNNWSDNGAGAIHHVKGPMTIQFSNFSDNSSGYQEAAIYHADGPLVISHSSFISNRSPGDWALIMATGGGSLFVEASLFSNNDAPLGTIRANWAIDASIVNSTISQNSGPIYSAGKMSIVSSTITQNSSTGVTYRPGDGAPMMTIMNSIVSDNAGGDCLFFDSINAVGANLDTDGSCTGFTLTADPLLAPLADNGGQTMTHALTVDSPAINAALSDCPATDQRDVPRILTICDLGAFEETTMIAQAPTLTSTNTSPATKTPTPEPGVPDRCSLFDPATITVTMLDIPPGTTRQIIYLTIPGGVPGLEFDLPEDPRSWEYTATLGQTPAEDCSYEGYDGRLYCTFELPEAVLGRAVELAVSVNGCADLIFNYPHVSIFEPEEQLSCSTTLGKDECVNAGGTYKDGSGMVSPVCNCP